MKSPLLSGATRKYKFFLILVTLAGWLGATGPMRAQTSRETEDGSHTPSPTIQRAQNHFDLLEGYKILEDLVDQESDLDKILVIRTVPPEMVGLLHDIAGSAKAIQEELHTFAKDDPNFHLRTTGLPQMEKKARGSEASETQNRILLGTTPEFRMELLLSQVQALTYGQHLMQVLSDSEDNRQRSAVMQEKSAQWKALRAQTVDKITNCQPPKK